MSELLTLAEAATKGIDRLRQPQWINPMDHIKIDLIGGATGPFKLGPWVHLWCPSNMECNKRDPVDILIFHVGTDKAEWLPYTGPLEDSDEYKAEVAVISADCARLAEHRTSRTIEC